MSWAKGTTHQAGGFYHSRYDQSTRKLTSREYNILMRSRFLLMLWVLGILFPMAWLGSFSPVFQQYFEIIFSEEWVHIVVHIGLYAGFAILILFAFDLKPGLSSLGWIVLIALVVGVGQEILQQITGHIPDLRWNSLLDLGVDILGASIGFAAVTVYKKQRQPY